MSAPKYVVVSMDDADEIFGPFTTRTGAEVFAIDYQRDGRSCVGYEVRELMPVREGLSIIREMNDR